MVSKRLKSDARAHMAQHPDLSYQEALREVAAAGPVGADPTVSVAGNEVAVDLLTALGIDDIATHDFAVAWSRNEGFGSLRVPFAYREGGDSGVAELEYLDLASAGGQGPHATIVGPTGSGKSYLLRTLVVGLAATYGPATVGFVLVDVKGGKTFRGLDELPHVVSSISSLSGDADQRLCEWIDGQLLRRRDVLIHAGVSDIDEYNKSLAGSAGERSSMPRLIVVIDELPPRAEMPDELRQTLVRIGRLGRAVGVHLVATTHGLWEPQYPELHQQINSRIALPLDEPQLFPPLKSGDEEGPLFETIVSRLRELQHTRALAKEPLPEEAAQLARIDTARAQIDAMIGQDGVKEQLHSILAEALADRELARRGRPIATTSRRYAFVGGPGTGKAHAVQLLADALYAAGAIDSARVVLAHRSSVGEGHQTGATTSAVFESARRGLLAIDIDDLAYPPFAYEAVSTLGDLIESEPGRVVVLCGAVDVVRRLLDASPRWAGMFGCPIIFTQLSPEDLWRYVVKFAHEAGYGVNPADGQQFQQLASELAEACRSDPHLLDQITNVRFARSIVDQARRLAARRLYDSGALAAASDEELVELGTADICSSARRVAAAAGVVAG